MQKTSYGAAHWRQTSAEGAYLEDGKGLEICDLLETGKDRFIKLDPALELHEGHVYPSHEAIDFYHHYKEDIAMFGEMA